MTDWSRQGLGYVMCQKYCKCTDITPICCPDGWMVCMVGSFFLSPAEENYAPIEGECLAVVNALHKTRYFTQGCDKLLICTDHKPLIPVITTKHLEDIDNPRLMRLVQKTLSWKFSAIHIPGRRLGGPDALSRNVHGDSKQVPKPKAWDRKACYNTSNIFPDPWEEEITCKEARLNILASLRTVLDKKYIAPDPELDVSDVVIASMELGIRSVSWEMVKRELQNDAKYRDLSTWIQEGCIGPATTLPLHIKPFWKLRGNLRCTDSVPMFDERTIVPESLRERVLSILH